MIEKHTDVFGISGRSTSPGRPALREPHIANVRREIEDMDVSDRPFWLTDEGRVTLALTYADMYAVDDLEELIRCIDIDIEHRHDEFENLKTQRKINIADVKAYRGGVDKLQLLRSIAMIRLTRKSEE